MASGINLVIYNNTGGATYDITELVQSIKWAGRKGSSSRTLDVEIIDDDGYKHARSGINIEEGYQCIFRYDGEELFRGIIMRQVQSNRKTMTFKAYDLGIYLANNKDTFCYENKTATDVFKDCCTRFGIPMGEVANCTYKIPELTKSKTTAWDAICDALSLDFDSTGVRHYVSSEKGKVSLLTRRENILQWVIEGGTNLSSYSFTRSIEKIKTRVKMVSKEGTTVAEKSLPDMEKKYGIFQEVDQPDESLTTAQINDLIKGILDEQGTPTRSLQLEALGKPDVISGIGVFIIIPELDLSRTFYVDSDTHTFKDNLHTMNLTLTYTSDAGKDDQTVGKASANTSDGNFKVGDVVMFNGGTHYKSSNASAGSGNPPAGKAKIYYQAAGAKHPWCLVHTDSSSWVYGWVDAGTFSAIS